MCQNKLSSFFLLFFCVLHCSIHFYIGTTEIESEQVKENKRQNEKEQCVNKKNKNITFPGKKEVT